MTPFAKYRLAKSCAVVAATAILCIANVEGRATPHKPGHQRQRSHRCQVHEHGRLLPTRSQLAL